MTRPFIPCCYRGSQRHRASRGDTWRGTDKTVLATTPQPVPSMCQAPRSDTLGCKVGTVTFLQLRKTSSLVQSSFSPLLSLQGCKLWGHSVVTFSGPPASGQSHLSGSAPGMWPGLRWAMHRPAHAEPHDVPCCLLPGCEKRRTCWVVAPLRGQLLGGGRLLHELASNLGWPGLQREKTGHTQVNLDFRSR